MKPKRWTKKDVRLLCSQLDNHVLFNRMYYPKAAILEDIRQRRRTIVEVGLASFKSLHADRSKEELATAEHFRAHPKIYGDSTPEMIERFTVLGNGSKKAADKLQELIDRVALEGLPPEVEGYEVAT